MYEGSLEAEKADHYHYCVIGVSDSSRYSMNQGLLVQSVLVRNENAKKNSLPPKGENPAYPNTSVWSSGV